MHLVQACSECSFESISARDLDLAVGGAQFAESPCRPSSPSVGEMVVDATVDWFKHRSLFAQGSEYK